MAIGAPHWDWTSVTALGPALLDAAIITIALTALVVIIGTAIGAGLGWLLVVPRGWWRPVAKATALGTRVVRAVPVLVLLCWVHFGAPGLTTWLQRIFASIESAAHETAGMTEASVLQVMAERPFASALFALTIAMSASVAAIVRDALEQVPDGMIDAAKAQGMGPWLRWRRVMIPEAWRTSLTALLERAISIMKYTTLAAVIGCTEVLEVVRQAGAVSGRWLEPLTVVALLFVAVLLPAQLLIDRLARSSWLRRHA